MTVTGLGGSYEHAGSLTYHQSIAELSVNAFCIQLCFEYIHLYVPENYSDNIVFCITSVGFLSMPISSEPVNYHI